MVFHKATVSNLRYYRRRLKEEFVIWEMILSCLARFVNRWIMATISLCWMQSAFHLGSMRPIFVILKAGAICFTRIYHSLASSVNMLFVKYNPIMLFAWFAKLILGPTFEPISSADFVMKFEIATISKVVRQKNNLNQFPLVHVKGVIAS